MITRAHVLPYVGQHVVVRTRDGMIHHGILHSVVDHGIYLRPIVGGPRYASGSTSASVVRLGELPQPGKEDIEQTWWPLLFLPWFLLVAFWPWAWWW
ncbi:MAG: hypothetical protein K6T83_18750 [Alicyclobacillus sp.]|nr:hypothetical protein [Alicyclobacillus sp.]